jgi:hypothetical protein
MKSPDSGGELLFWSVSASRYYWIQSNLIDIPPPPPLGCDGGFSLADVIGVTVLEGAVP